MVVAPRARVIRDGEVVELLAGEVVPGDIVEIEPGDQLVADGEVVRTRGMTLDESVLTGEADGVRKGLGERALSGSYCVSGSGYYQVDAVREQSYAGSIAGEARAFRHPALPAAGGGQPGDPRLHLPDDPAGDPPDRRPATSARSA